MICASLSLAVAAFWGGALNDRVFTGSVPTGVMTLLGVPLASVLAVASLVFALWNDDQEWRWTPALVGSVLFCFWCAISLVRTHDPYSSQTMFCLLASALALSGAISRGARDRLTIHGILIAIVVVASIVSALGVSEYIGQLQQHNPSWRVFSTFTVPNFLAGYLVMVIPITMAVFLCSSRRELTILAGLGLCLQGACLLLTGSRFGLLTIAASLIAFAIIVWRIGLSGAARGRARVLLVLAGIALVVGARPVWTRILNVGAESHSNQFRFYTWSAAIHMARANPITGVGFGTFDTASAPYSQVAYTQHAHNTFLQVASETGYPGMLFFLAALAGILAAATPTLASRRRNQPKEPAAEEKAVGELEEIARDGSHDGRKRRRERISVTRTSSKIVPEGRGLIMGDGLVTGSLVVAIAGAVIRNLFDSDLYVPANAFTFCALCGLVSAHVRASRGPVDVAHDLRYRPIRVSRTVKRALICLAAVGIGARATLVGAGRMQVPAAEEALAKGNLRNAADSWRTAASLDVGNPEYYLKLAMAHDLLDQTEDAEEDYRKAIQLKNTGIPHYRYGKFLLKRNRRAEAIREFERAREVDPGSLPNLMMLGDAYTQAGRQADALEVWRRIVALHQSPYGQVRAIPEIEDWEFSVGYLGLAADAEQRNDLAEAERNLNAGVTILTRFWDQRKNPMVLTRIQPEALKAVSSRYALALNARAGLLRRMGRTAEAAKVEQDQVKLRDEITREFETPQG